MISDLNICYVYVPNTLEQDITAVFESCTNQRHRLHISLALTNSHALEPEYKLQHSTALRTTQYAWFEASLQHLLEAEARAEKGEGEGEGELAAPRARAAESRSECTSCETSTGRGAEY